MLGTRLSGLAARALCGVLTLALSLLTFPGDSAAAFYTTTFPAAENPISEGSNWTNGATTGVDWSDIVMTPGLAHGTQTGADGFNDSIAVLNGVWGADQHVRAVVHTVNQSNDGSFNQEVELLLRFTVTPHSAQGYEINFSCSGENGFTEIVRWNGPFGDFTYVQQQSGSQFAVQDGDVIEATIVGNVITVFKNGVEVNRGIDDTYTSGNPGMGFFARGATSANNTDFGFTVYTASSNDPIDTTPPIPTPRPHKREHWHQR